MKQLISIVLVAAIITTPVYILAQDTEDEPKISEFHHGLSLFSLKYPTHHLKLNIDFKTLSIYFL